MKRYLLLSAFFALSACGTSAEPSYFSLAPQDGEQITDVNTTIKVQRPLVPNYLDRPDFVFQESHYHLSIDERSNWAEPLDGMFARVLAADLQQRLPQSIVWAGNDDMASPRFIVTMNLQSFNPIAHGQISLQGIVVISDRKSGKPLQSKPFQLTDATTGSSQSIAVGLSHLISLEADEVAHDLAFLAHEMDQKASN